jgi:hypothetical protein
MTDTQISTERQLQHEEITAKHTNGMVMLILNVLLMLASAELFSDLLALIFR